MLFTDENIKSSSSYLNSLSGESLVEFCESVESLIESNNFKSEQDNQVQAHHRFIINACVEAIRTKGTLDELENVLSRLSVNENTAGQISKVLIPEKMLIKSALEAQEGYNSEIPSYSNLEWRLQATVASRSLRNQLEPKIVLRLETSNSNHPTNSTTQVQTLTCSPPNLLNFRNVLEEALIEAKSQHMQKLLRQLK